MAPRSTARISVDLLIPSQRAASLVKSAGFMTYPTGANASTASNLRCAPAGSRLCRQPAELFGVLGASGGGSEVDQAGPDQLAQAALHRIHAILGARLEHVPQLPRLAFLDQVLDREGVEQDFECADPARPVPPRQELLVDDRRQRIGQLYADLLLLVAGKDVYHPID